MKKIGLTFLAGTLLTGATSFVYFNLPDINSLNYTNNTLAEVKDIKEVIVEKQPDVFEPIYIEIPEAVKAVYMTACIAGTPSLRKNLVKLIEETELNSVIIDIKDYTGGIAFISEHPELKDKLSKKCYVSDMPEFVKSLNEKGIYVIGRITVFQDPLYANLYPEVAVKKDSDRNVIWADYKKINYVDAGSQQMWDYIVELSKESRKLGFDELNFDYIRFPSDGDMRDIYYPFSEEKVVSDPDLGKAKIMREFFSYLRNGLEETGVVMSADLFGMTTTNPDDLNIGQILEYAEPYFDYLSPMVYPSHYPKGFNGYSNVNDHPYEIVKFSMDRGVIKLKNASSSPLKLRPWLQDFDYGGNYGPEEVRAQIQATYDAGLTSWMLWDPSNRYTREALESIDLN